MRIAGTVLSEPEYKADLEVLDRYQAYSAEVARLATLSIIAFGFLRSLAFHDGHRTDFGGALEQRRCFLLFGIVSLGAAIGCALAHRYFSTDALASLVRRLRLIKGATNDSNTVDDDMQLEQAKERVELLRSLKLSARLIAAASVLLVVGALCLALTAMAAFAI